MVLFIYKNDLNNEAIAAVERRYDYRSGLGGKDV